jgi:hypothetical protein
MDKYSLWSMKSIVVEKARLNANLQSSGIPETKPFCKSKQFNCFARLSVAMQLYVSKRIRVNSKKKKIYFK